MNIKVLGIIPARGGSKGIPHKNLRLLGNKPLLQYTAESALNSIHLSHVILSTDDLEIAEIGRNCGLDVPFIRPAELARDDTPTLPVIQHTIKWVEMHQQHYDAICLLQPTNPFRPIGLIDSCIELFLTKNADSVFTIQEVPSSFNPHWVFFEREDGSLCISTGESEPIPRRQLLPKAYHRDGSVYITHRDVLMEQKSLYGKNSFGYFLAGEKTVNLDSMEDWELAEKIISGSQGN